MTVLAKIYTCSQQFSKKLRNATNDRNSNTLSYTISRRYLHRVQTQTNVAEFPFSLY